MAEPFLLIDGYNLMHALGMARLRYGPGDLERCRHRFLTHVTGRLTSPQRSRTTIVFDAADAPHDTPRERTIDDVTVLFAPGGDADAMIESLIARHSAPRQVRLVSSDHRLQKAARRRRAAFVDSEDFAAELESTQPAGEPQDPAGRGARRRALKEGERLSPDELQDWLEVFGDVPEADQLRTEAEQWEAEFDDLDELTDDEEDPTVR